MSHAEMRRRGLRIERAESLFARERREACQGLPAWQGGDVTLRALACRVLRVRREGGRPDDLADLVRRIGQLPPERRAALVPLIVGE